MTDRPDSAAPADPAIHTSGLGKRFGRRQIVAEVGMAVPAGSIYGLIGLNGAGKSTLLRTLVGLLPPSSGSVRIVGIDPHADPVALGSAIGYVPDRPHLHPWMRVGELLRFVRSVRHGWDQPLVDRLLALGRIDVRQRVRKLSKGTAAKLCLLLALAHDPRVLILDEPTDGFDPIARDDFLEQVIESSGVGPDGTPRRTILLSSHSMSDVQRVTDHIGLMHEGRLIVQCPTDRLVMSTKRIRAVAEPGAVLRPPPSAVCSRRSGREWTVTVSAHDHADDPSALTGPALDAMRDQGADIIEVQDLDLDEIFKDYVRGRQEPQPC